MLLHHTKKAHKRSSKTKWNNATENERRWKTCKISSRIIRRADKNARCLASCVQGQRFLELHLGFVLFVACPFVGAASRARPNQFCVLFSTLLVKQCAHYNLRFYLRFDGILAVVIDLTIFYYTYTRETYI